MRRTTTALGAALLLAMTGSAEAQEACASSYEQAQRRRAASDFVGAKGEAELCARSCPKMLAKDCEGWAKEVSAKIARLDIHLAGATPLPAGAALIVDGVPRLLAPAGSARVEVNPGKHTAAAEVPGFERIEQSIDVAAGAEARVELTLTPRRVPVSSPGAAPPSSPLPGIVVGSAGLAALLAGGALGLAGHLSRRGLLADNPCAATASCPHNPDLDGQVSRIRALWIAGGVTAAAGLVGVAVGGGLLLARRGDTESGARVSLGLGPSFSGLVVGGWF